MVEVLSVFESYNKCFISEFFCFGHTLFNLARMFAVDHEKTLISVLITSSLEKIIVWGKSLKKKS